MLHRIKWEEDALKNPSEKDKNNQCVLIWEVSQSWLDKNVNF